MFKLRSAMHIQGNFSEITSSNIVVYFKKIRSGPFKIEQGATVGPHAVVWPSML